MLTETDLHEYQQRGVDFVYERDAALVLVKMGGGKTVVAATAACELLEEGDIKRVLIVAPKRVAELVWPEEFTKWQHLHHMGISLAIGTPAKRREAFARHGHIVVIGVDNMLWAIKEGLLDGFDAIIFDDCMPRGHKGELFKALKKLKIKTRWGLTGTVTSNKHVGDLFARVYCVDGGARLGRSFSKFRSEHFIYDGPNSWNWRPREDALERVMDKISDITYTVETYDGLPEVVVNDIWVDLPPKARLAYDEMEKTYVVDGGDFVVDAANAGVKSSKLRQIASGFIYADDGTAHVLHTAKLEALTELLNVRDGLPTLIAYAFREELRMMHAQHPAPTMTDKSAYDDWNAGKLGKLYLHPDSAGHGLNMQRGGDTLIFHGLEWDLDLYEQPIARLRRQGQLSASVWVHRILARNTIDEDMVRRLETNCTIREAVEAGLKRRQAR